MKKTDEKKKVTKKVSTKQEKVPTGMENMATLKLKIEECQEDAEKCFEKLNNSAGIRLRKTLKEIKVLTQTIKIQSLGAKE